MDMNELNKYRDERDHQSRYGHLNEKDRSEIAYHRYGKNPGDKDYHSPNGVNVDAHGAELQ